jgi:hypothetical protein
MDESETYRGRIGGYQSISKLSGYSNTPTKVSDAYRTHSRIKYVSDIEYMTKMANLSNAGL